MKILKSALALSFAIFASSAQADQVINVDGEDYFLSHLTANCQSIQNDPAGQIACFAALSALLAEQTEPEVDNSAIIAPALETLRTVAQYADNDTGLLIAGSDCNVQFIYYGNYFHISRRNISTVDLFSAAFDASKMQFDQLQQVQGAQVPLMQGAVDGGSVATVVGGVGLDSSLEDFDSRSPDMTMQAYATTVVTQLVPREEQTFNFVLVHPQRSQASAEIQSAFEAFVTACRG